MSPMHPMVWIREAKEDTCVTSVVPKMFLNGPRSFLKESVKTIIGSYRSSLGTMPKTPSGNHLAILLGDSRADTIGDSILLVRFISQLDVKKKTKDWSCFMSWLTGF